MSSIKLVILLFLITAGKSFCQVGQAGQSEFKGSRSPGFDPNERQGARGPSFSPSKGDMPITIGKGIFSIASGFRYYFDMASVCLSAFCAGKKLLPPTNKRLPW